MSATTSPTTASDPVEPAPNGDRFPVRLAVALFLSAIAWIAPYIGSLAVVLPYRVAEILPDSAETVLAGMALAGALSSLFSNVVFGGLSDLTRSRFGRRAPWILVGAVGSAASMYYLSTVTTATTLIVGWVVFLTFLNALIAAMVAVISDRVTPKHRGSISSIYGVGMIAGSALSQIVGAQFSGSPTTGLVVFAVVALISGVLFVVVAPERSNRHQPREAFSGRMLLHQFSFPTHGTRDYYFALFGKFLLQASLYAITNYQVFILMDYIGLSRAASAGVITVCASIQLVCSLVFGLGSGPLSDRVGRRKPFVIGAALLIGIGAFVPFLAPFTWAFILFTVLSGAGNGVYASVDQALNIEVLPNKETAAKDLGILNMANSGGQMLGPVITTVVLATAGSYRWVFLASCIMLVVSGLLIAPIRKVR